MGIVLVLKEQIRVLEEKMKNHVDSFTAEEFKRNETTTKLQSLLKQLEDICLQIKEKDIAYEMSLEEIKTAEKERKEKKSECKTWMADFEKEHGKAPTNSDKESVRYMFRELKMCDKAWNQ